MKKLAGILCIICVFGMVQSVLAAPLAIVNGDFETGADNDAPPFGWTDNSATASFWLGVADETGNPTQAEWDTAPNSGLGTMTLTTARQSAGVGSQPVNGQLIQVVDLSSFATEIDAGEGILNMSFVYGSDDYRDTGTFSLRFFDVSDVELGVGYSVALDAVGPTNYEFTGWLQKTIGGLMPVNTRSVMLQIDTTRTGGSETNIWIDNITGNMVPEPATLALLGLGALVLRRKK